MSAERERSLSLRWGLVTLGFIGYALVRASIALVQDVIAVTLPVVRPIVLAQRLSQLKPAMWKAGHLSGYYYATVAMCVIIIGAMAWAAVRAILRDRDPDRNDGEPV